MTDVLLVVAHDAGGAEVVSSWVKRHLGMWDVQYLLAGPAVEIFDRKIPNWSRSVRTNPDFVLCGSSFPPAWEAMAIETAVHMEIPNVVYLDHWKNYRGRFHALPDEIWVCDPYAAAIAQGDFPETPVSVQGNPYLDDFEEEFARARVSQKAADDVERVLWIDEPGRRREFRWYARSLQRAEILLRLHPSTPLGSYKASLAAYTGVCGARVAERGETLAENVAWADTVVGCDSMALVAALTVGKRVISVIPENESSIPYVEIERPFGSDG